MKRSVLLVRLCAALLAAAAWSGCSLLKVSVSTGDPLPKEQLRIRTMTRGFYYEMTDEVARTADSIAAAAPDAATRMAAVRWKIRTTRAAVDAAMQGMPDVALADLWILCRRMDTEFALRPDSLLFGAQSGMARAAAARLDRQVGTLARRLLDAERYALMADFVAEYVAENPLPGEDTSDNTTLAWIDCLERHGLPYDAATGSIAEVLADVNDRVSARTQQLSSTLGWSGDLLGMQLRQDSLRTQVGAQLDSLERSFDRMVAVAEQLPDISERALAELRVQVEGVMASMDATVQYAFSALDMQRETIQTYVSRERQAAVEQLRASAEELVVQTMEQVPGLVGRIVLYVVLALVVLIGGPFALGFWLGGVRQRVRDRRPERPA